MALVGVVGGTARAGSEVSTEERKKKSIQRIRVFHSVKWGSFWLCLAVTLLHPLNSDLNHNQ